MDEEEITAWSRRSVGADAAATLQNLGLEIREINAANGWAVTQPEEFADKYKFPAVLMLIVSEAAEALEAFREGDAEHFKEEMADILIRVLDCAVAVDPDFDATVKSQTTGQSWPWLSSRRKEENLMPVFMVHKNWASASFVKTLEFFESQGGNEKEWGKAWTRVLASDIEDARRICNETVEATKPRSPAASPSDAEKK